MVQQLVMMLVGLAELYYCTTTLSCNKTAPGMSVRGQTAAVTLVALEALVAGTFLSYLHTRRVRWLAFKRVEAVRSAARRGVAHRRAASTAFTALDLVASAQQGLLDTVTAAASAAGLKGSAGAVELPAPDLSVKGALTVFVLRARGLESTDRNGLADPYVKVTVGSTTRKTKVMPRTLDPEWFERLGFEGVLRDIVAKPAQVVVYDRDVLTRDDKLGQRARPPPCSVSFIDASQSRLSGEVALDLSLLLLQPSTSPRRTHQLHHLHFQDGKQGLLSKSAGPRRPTPPPPPPPCPRRVRRRRSPAETTSTCTREARLLCTSSAAALWFPRSAVALSTRTSSRASAGSGASRKWCGRRAPGESRNAKSPACTNGLDCE